jgi:hypothetical protein
MAGKARKRIARIATVRCRYRTSERIFLSGGQPTEAQEYLKQVAGKVPEREHCHLGASLH